MRQLVEALERLDGDDACRCVVITGAGERAFAAGADIREMSDATPVSLTLDNSFARWERIRRVRVPLIAAVRGYALGGGCELAMACDMIVASDDADVRPAGDQDRRHPRRGRHAAPDPCARQGQGDGADPHRPHARRPRGGGARPGDPGRGARGDGPGGAGTGGEVAAMPPLAVIAAKEAVNRAYELSLEAGLEFERRNFFLLFASEDQKEGMRAFIEKRPAEWKGR